LLKDFTCNIPFIIEANHAGESNHFDLASIFNMFVNKLVELGRIELPSINVFIYYRSHAYLVYKDFYSYSILWKHGPVKQENVPVFNTLHLGCNKPPCNKEFLLLRLSC